VTGDYHFQPQNEGGNHRRSVKWLAVLDESLPIDIIHEGNLSQASCYLLTPGQMKLDALAELITTEPSPPISTPEPFVLIIDEINRANVSKVFGELITLLEPDKRLGEPNAITVKLPYSKDVFGVPNNLYIIGTMNTADRSIALLDTALRRRFDFEEMMPDYECLKNKETDGIHIGKLLSAINNRVEWLFDRDHQIGHSYFIDVENKADLDAVMQKKIIPLLAEYFYEDWEKVRAVLNDTGKWFVMVEKLTRPPMLKEGEARSRYGITKDAIDVKGYLSAMEGNDVALEQA
jgi:5-methylcytosine-specific restriction protein B